jgi:hypothetical protein
MVPETGFSCLGTPRFLRVWVHRIIKMEIYGKRITYLWFYDDKESSLGRESLLHR